MFEISPVMLPVHVLDSVVKTYFYKYLIPLSVWIVSQF